MNIVLIGLGMVSDTHIAAVKASGLNLYGVLARSLDKAAKASSVFPDTILFQTVEDIASDPNADFVILATPPNARVEIVDTLSRAGKPVLSEKPIERTFQAAKQVVDLCASRGVPLGITFQHRARAASQALKDKIDEGFLGDIVSLDMTVPWWRPQSYYDAPGRGTYARDGGGVLINQAIHTLDLGLWLCGPMAKVQARLRTTSMHRMEAEDWASAFFKLVSGATGSLTASTTAYPGGTETVRIQGTLANATLAAGVLDIAYLDGRLESFGEQATTGGGADPMAFTHAWHQSIIEDFATCLKTGASPIATGQSALMAHAAIAAMEDASAKRAETEVAQI